LKAREAEYLSEEEAREEAEATATRKPYVTVKNKPQPLNK
jgi:hypothetical protein